jgi:hypothetical protein
MNFPTLKLINKKKSNFEFQKQLILSFVQFWRGKKNIRGREGLSKSKTTQNQQNKHIE